MEPARVWTVPVVVRRISVGEGELLKRVRLAALRDSPFAFGSTYGAEVDRADAEWADRARLGAAGADRATFLGIEGADVVGLAGAYRDGIRTEVELVSMWTSPTARRRGIGRQLVRSVVDWAETTGAERVGLWVTRGNEPASVLYEGIGFEATGDYQPLPSDPCKDELRMVLRLTVR